MDQHFKLDGWTDCDEGIHEVLNASGVYVFSIDGEVRSNNPALALIIRAAYSPKSSMLPGKIGAIKAEAQRRIFKVLPQHKQTNLLAQRLENILAFGPDSTTWPNAQKQIKADDDIVWSRIKTLRTASDAIEAKLAALSDWQEINAYDAATDPDWPE